MSDKQKNSAQTLSTYGTILWWIGTITIVGIPALWPVAYMLFGFAELIENSQKQTHYLAELYKKQVLPAPQPKPAPAPASQKPKMVTPKQPVAPKAPATQVDSQEQTYLFAMQMYQQRSYNIAYNAFAKIPGYKDADKYIAELKKD